jgi:adenylate cyclase
MIKLEKTYLVKHLPANLSEYPHIEFEDVYIPADVDLPKIRLRRGGDKYFLTKKIEVKEGGGTVQRELNTDLTFEEYEVLRDASERLIRKIRYYYDLNGQIAEIDVFSGPLQGLVLAVFEFDSPENKKRFIPPEFCLADVTSERFIVGGRLSGMSYDDIEPELGRFGYVRL